MEYTELLEEYEGIVDIYGDERDYLEQIVKVPEKIRNLIVLHHLVSEVLNGGLLQFFCNSSGIVAPEAVKALDSIGQPKAKALLETGMARLGPNYPRDRETRMNLFRHTYLLEGTEPSPFNELDDEFYAFGKYGDEMWKWLDQYAEFGSAS